MEESNYSELFFKYRYYILAILIGVIFVGGGFLFFKKSLEFTGTKVEILKSEDIGSDGHQVLTAEIAGSVIKPGVYKLPGGSRIDDLLITAGGFSAQADRVWTDKYLNRASVLTDGQKVYIPSVDEQSQTSSANSGRVYQNGTSEFSSDSKGLININTASLNQLDELPGIGPKYGQKIIDHRPYSKTEELVTKGAITQTLYEKIKDSITIY